MWTSTSPVSARIFLVQTVLLVRPMQDWLWVGTVSSSVRWPGPQRVPQAWPWVFLPEPLPAPAAGGRQVVALAPVWCQREFVKMLAPTWAQVQVQVPRAEQVSVSQRVRPRVPKCVKRFPDC